MNETDSTQCVPRAAKRSEPIEQWRQMWRWSLVIAQWPRSRAEAVILAQRRWYGSYLSVGLDLALTFAGQFILSVVLFTFVVGLFVAGGHDPTSASGRRELAAWLASPQATLAGLLLTQGVMAVVLWHRLLRLRLGWALVGLGRVLRRGAGRAVLIGAGLGVLALVLSSAVGSALQALGLDQGAQDRTLIQPLHNAPQWGVLAIVLAGVVVAPVVEEAFFRGYVFRALAVRKGLPVAYGISAGAFALFHQLPTLIPVFFVMGLLLCWAYQYTGHLLAPITAHAVNNSVAFALALVPWPGHM